MKKVFAFLFLLCLSIAAHAQQTVFVPNCAGSNDTSAFTALITKIGAGSGTIRLPFKVGSRCAVNSLTIPANVALDNSDGTGISVNPGQTLTVLGAVVAPSGKTNFFGSGTTSFAGNTVVGSANQAFVSNGSGGYSFVTIATGGSVTSVFGRSGVVIATTNDYTWAQINKTVSSLADLATRSAAELSNGTIGSGPVVLQTSATLITPTIGVAVATTVNGLTITTTTGTFSITNGKTFSVLNTVSLAGSSDGFTLTVPATGTAVLTSRTITEGAGLAGNTYDLSANRTLALGTPSTLTVSTSNSASGTTHAHAITSSANPGAAASILASNSSGYLQLVRLGLGTSPTVPLEVAGDVLVNAATANLFLKDISTGFLSASTTVINPQANNTIRSTAYTSGLVGWNISATGSAEFDNIDVRGSIHASVFSFNSIAATAGTLGVFKSAAKLKNSVTVTAGPTYGTTTFTIDVEDGDGTHAQGFAVNDILRIKGLVTGGVADTWFKTTAASDQTTFWRYTASIQAGSNTVTYNPGLGVADYGPANSGFIIQTADQTNAPYLQMATHSATFSSANSSGTLNITPQLRLGNLNGSYGYVSDIYGLGTGQYGTASKSWLTMDQTNGLRIGNNLTVLAQWDTAGDITVGQVASGQSNIKITSGQVNLRNNITTRIRLDTDGSGFVANNLISWDTSGNLTVSGNATIGGFAIGTDYIRDAANSFGMASTVTGGDDVRFWAGATFANRATAPFRVTEAGVMTATSGTFSGALSAATGTFAGTVAAGSITATQLSIGNFENLAEDPGAENGGATWTLGTGATIVTSGSARSGAKYFNMNTTAIRIENNLYASCAPGDIFYAESYYKQTGGGTFVTVIGWYTAAKVLVSYSAGAIIDVDGGGWTRTAVTATAPATAAYARVGGLTAGTAGWFIDDFYMRRGATSGWTFDATKISSTGINIISGASAGLAFGATPPTSASAGTGIWLDRTGLYSISSGTANFTLTSAGLAFGSATSASAGTGVWIDRTGLYGLLSNTVQAKLDATTGAITAGGGQVSLDVNGLRLEAFSNDVNQVKWHSTAQNFDAVYMYGIDQGNGAHDGQWSLFVRNQALSRQERIDFSYVTGLSHYVFSTTATTFVVGSSTAVTEQSAALQVNSTTGAFLPPRMTGTQRDALTPINGMVLYNTTIDKLQVRAAGAWVDLH